MTNAVTRPTIEQLAEGVRTGNRAMLARAITLVESGKPEHQSQAQDLLQHLLPHTGNAIRIGITGVPGVGKSTTIDQLGMNLIAGGQRVAVLAVDPTSKRSGGSILGDKTRMNRLASHPSGYVRPSPTSGTLGGVAKKTRETLALAEAAGYDVVIVETVGVGQSEVTVADMVDFFLVLLLPGGGDELQGIKKGIIEVADMIAINKADGDNIDRARQSASDYRGALGLITPSSANWQPPVVTISGLSNLGLDELWQKVLDHRARMIASGEFQERRKAQAVGWMHDLLTERLMGLIRHDKAMSRRLTDCETRVRQGALTPSRAVDEIMEHLTSAHRPVTSATEQTPSKR
jgi:LAO/AO transport system kinase